VEANLVDIGNAARPDAAKGLDYRWTPAEGCKLVDEEARVE
jgi:hypothetical protein